MENTILNIGEIIEKGHTNYQITSATSYEEMGLHNIAKKCKETGKEPFLYHAAKVLKNGTLSKKVGISFLRFISNGKIIFM